jgi:hypothetical protein
LICALSDTNERQQVLDLPSCVAHAGALFVLVQILKENPGAVFLESSDEATSWLLKSAVHLAGQDDDTHDRLSGCVVDPSESE